jgi:hypothetical protein
MRAFKITPRFAGEMGHEVILGLRGRKWQATLADLRSYSIQVHRLSLLGGRNLSEVVKTIMKGNYLSLPE